MPTTKGHKYVVSSGQTSSGLVLGPLDTLTVLAGGSALVTRIGSGAYEYVSSGGVESGATVLAGGSEVVSNGGVASAVTVSSGGRFTLLNGGVELLATVASGGSDFVSSGASAYLDTVLSGGVETVYAGGRSTDAMVSAGGTLSGGGTLAGGHIYGTVSGVNIANGSFILNSYQTYLQAGGVANAVSMTSGGTFNIVGGTASGVTVFSGTVQLSAGSVLAADLAGGAMNVLGGTASGTLIHAGTETVQGGSDQSATVYSSGTLIVSSGGTASGAAVSSGGALDVLSGGAEVSGTVFSGGSETVSSGGTASGTTVSSGGTLTVSSGGTANATWLDYAATLNVSGIASGANIGGTETIFWGGEDFAATIGQGTQVVLSGGVTSNVNVDGYYATQIISSGGFAYNTSAPYGVVHVRGGGHFEGGSVGSDMSYEGYNALYLETGANSYATTVLPGGYEEVGSGAEADYGHVSSGGRLVVDVGGLAYGATVDSGGSLFGAGSIEDSSINGSVSGVTLVPGWWYGTFLGTGGVGSNLTVEAPLTLNGGSLSGGVVSSGGTVMVSSGGVASGVGVSSGGAILVSSGGVDTSATLYTGGAEIVSSGGVASGTIVSSGGTLTVSSGGASDAVVWSGGRLVLQAGATASGATINAGGVAEFVQFSIGNGQTFTLSSAYTSANVSGVTIAGGGVVLDQTAISHGGTMSLGSGARTSNVTVLSGGVLDGPGELVATDTVYGLASGVALGDTAGGHGQLFVQSGGVISGLLEKGRYDLVDVASGGLTVAGHVTGGQANLVIEQGAVASGTVVTGVGNAEGVFGSSVNAVVSSAGTEAVESGGVARAATVAKGGAEIVYAGGSASGTKVLSGGVLSVATGANASTTVVSSGGTLVDNGQAIWSGTVASTLGGALSGAGSLVKRGAGTLTISADASGFTGKAVISGGVLELATAGGLGGAAIDFAAPTGSAKLKIDAADQPANGASFAETLIDFDKLARSIDLAGLPFSSGATATLSGTTLTVSDGGYTAAFTLSGTAAASYVAVSDGAGGTLIHAKAGAATMPLVHAMAAFGGEGAPGTLSPVSSGGSGSGLIAPTLGSGGPTA